MNRDHAFGALVMAVIVFIAVLVIGESGGGSEGPEEISGVPCMVARERNGHIVALDCDWDTP